MAATSLESNQKSCQPQHDYDNVDEDVENRSEVVVVTGGAGFLGKHIVKHVMEQKEFPVREVRVFDIQPLEWSYGFEEIDSQILLRYYEGNISNQVDLQKAFDGATVVIHNASVIDTSSSPDLDKLHQVNVEGTKTVIRACLACNIKFLLYTSSATADKKIGAYGKSKRQAEDFILGANQERLQNGQTLSTCALRPPGMYGEGDHNLVEALKKLIVNNTFIRLGNNDPVYQSTYAGNVAWAFVSAIQHLRQSTTDADLNHPRGCAIDVGDNTPRVSFSGYMEPFVTHIGAKLSAFYVPYWVLLIIAIIFEWISYLLKPFYPVSFPLSKMGVVSFYSLPNIRNEVARKYLNYTPLYSYETALSRSLRYYSHEYNLKKQ